MPVGGKPFLHQTRKSTRPGCASTGPRYRTAYVEEVAQYTILTLTLTGIDPAMLTGMDPPHAV
jgi:hypothetical protein